MPQLEQILDGGLPHFHTITGFRGTIGATPLIALFGVVEGEVRLSAVKQRTLAFASLLAWRPILLRWRDPIPPTHAQWLTEVMSCLKLEKIRYSLVILLYPCFKPFSHMAQPRLINNFQNRLIQMSWSSLAVTGYCFTLFLDFWFCIFLFCFSCFWHLLLLGWIWMFCEINKKFLIQKRN